MQSFTIVSLVHMFLNKKTKGTTKPLSILPGAHTLSTHLHHCPQKTPNTTVKLNSTNTQTKHQTNTKACVFVYTPLQRKGDVQKYCMYFTVMFMASCLTCIATPTQHQSQTSAKCTRHVHHCHHNHGNKNYHPTIT